MLEQRVDDHEERISKLEETDYVQRQKIVQMEASIQDSLAENNHYLMEISSQQQRQNHEILREVLRGNQESQERNDEAERQQEANRAELWKLALGSGGAVGAVIIIIQYIIQSLM